MCSIVLMYISCTRTSKNCDYCCDSFNWILKRFYIKTVRKGFKYIGHHLSISVLPQSAFMKMFFPTSFTQYRLRLSDKVFSLFWLNFKLFEVNNLNSQIFFFPLLLLLWKKVFFHEIKTNSNKKVAKRD